jgi:hypothetical protein
VSWRVPRAHAHAVCGFMSAKAQSSLERGLAQRGRTHACERDTAACAHTSGRRGRARMPRGRGFTGACAEVARVLARAGWAQRVCFDVVCVHEDVRTVTGVAGANGIGTPHQAHLMWTAERVIVVVTWYLQRMSVRCEGAATSRSQSQDVRSPLE